MREQDLKLLRLRIMTEVNKRFDELLEELNANGSEFSRALKKEVERLEKETHDHIEEVYSYMKSKLVSIEAGQQMLYDPNDGLLTKILKKAEATVKMATDSAACTVEARKAAEDARGFVRSNILVNAGTLVAVIGLFVTMLIFVISFTAKMQEQLTAQQAVVKAMEEKIRQDAGNQHETVAILKDLKVELKKAGK